MASIDFNAQAEALCQLLRADAVLYWRLESRSLALPLGAAPAGLLDRGFRPPRCDEGTCLLRCPDAWNALPLKLRSDKDPETCVALVGTVGKQGGILAAWFGADALLPEAPEGILDFALATLGVQLDLAAAPWEKERSQARRISGMADALPHGVIVVPPDNGPAYVNGLAAQWLGLPPGLADAGELASRLAVFAQGTDDPEALRAQVGDFIANRGETSLSGRVWRFCDRTPGALRVTVAPVDPERPAGWFWLLEDVSAAEAEAEARERQRRLEWQNAELEARVAERTAQLEHANEILLQANIELQHFAHAMAHDLQTPLRSIAGFAQLVQSRVKQYGDPEVDGWSAQVIANTRRLQVLIQGLLSYARSDAQALRAEPVDTGRVFDEVVASLQAMVDESGAEIRRGPLPTVPGIRSQIGQVLQNLIENGLKYNTSSPPRVFVSSRQEEGHWVISVTDNGMGIDPKHHDRVFGMFSRLHAYGDIPGTGIGLALCRRIVERHGGRIWVESREGEGATFHCALPADRTPSPAADPPLAMEGP